MIEDKLQARISEKEAQEHDEMLRNKALDYFICPECAGDMCKVNRSLMQMVRGALQYKCDQCNFKHEYYEDSYY